jgi:drug/metabolite transporter (DMT)-like permease
MKNSLKGYLFALAASLALANSFVFSKAALQVINIIEFGFLWFGLGTIWNFGWLIFKSRSQLFKARAPGVIGLALLIAVIEGAATGLFYIAIREMENPAIVSFIGNIGPVFVTVMGITLLKEKFNKYQISGILLTLIGVFVISYRRGSDLAHLFQPGSQYVILAAVLFAIATITARKQREKLDPELMSTIRSAIMFLFFAVIFIFKNQSLSLSSSTWIDLLVGSFLETLLTIVFAYQALRYIEATKTSLIISTKGIWVLISAYFMLNTFPAGYELLGGLLTVIGVTLITLGRRINGRLSHIRKMLRP